MQGADRFKQASREADARKNFARAAYGRYVSKKFFTATRQLDEIWIFRVPYRIALGVEYDGSCFCGWQSQLSGCGVQDILERALSSIAGNLPGW